MAQKFKTKITEMLGIEHPIICGGMQWISRAEIVAAVGNAGGIGFITAESLETPEDLREEIQKIRDLTDKAFGINISMVPEFGMPERTLQFCDVVVEEDVPNGVSHPEGREIQYPIGTLGPGETRQRGCRRCHLSLPARPSCR